MVSGYRGLWTVFIIHRNLACLVVRCRFLGVHECVHQQEGPAGVGKSNKIAHGRPAELFNKQRLNGGTRMSRRTNKR